MSETEYGDGPAVYVVGAINVDLVVRAPSLPGPGETVVGGDLQLHGGGKGANSAVACARAGMRTFLIGAVGQDENGTRSTAELEGEGVDVSGVAVLPGVATGVALIVVDDSGENQVTVGAGANAQLAKEHVVQQIEARVGPADVVLVSTEIPGDTAAAAVAASRTRGARCVLNPAPPLPELIGVLSAGLVVTPNAGESRALATMAGVSGDTVEAAAVNLSELTGASVVVTLGGDGVLVSEPGRSPTYHQPRPAEVKDTTGAGDTFNGVLAATLATGGELEHAVAVANCAGSLSVREIGARTGMPSRQDIEAHCRETEADAS